MFKLDFKRQRNQIPNCQHLLDHQKAKEFQKNLYFCFVDYAKAFESVGHDKLRKILKEMGIPDHLTCLLRNLYKGQEAIELDMEQWSNSKSGKEYVKVVYCHPAYLMYMFQCYFLKASRLLFLPLSPKFCSLHLRLLCCPAYGIISTIFLDSIYTC